VPIINMLSLDLHNKRVMIREDFNVPLKEDGKITDDTRIRACIPTIKAALKQSAKIILLSHLGRPKEGYPDASLSLLPVARHLEQLLHYPVRFVENWLDGITINPGEIVLCENVRFNIGEETNNENLARKMAALCDIFIMDAFGTAHRAQASTEGIARFSPIAAAGPLLVNELNALHQALKNPARPMVAIVGGAKVSGKLKLLENLLDQTEFLIVGGGIANTFLAATGKPVGCSLYEPKLVDDARNILHKAEMKGIQIPIPIDVVCGKSFSSTTKAVIKNTDKVEPDDLILDIGPHSCETLEKIMKSAGTIVWNGPVGVFEFPAFSQGTRRLAQAIAESPAFSIAGGGDTLAAIAQFNIADHISYISTGGGAFLEYLEGRVLPAVAVLETRGSNYSSPV